jgi:hypothetical protein
VNERRESRLQADELVRLTLIGILGEPTIYGLVSDISDRGLSVTVPGPMACGVQVKVEGDEALVMGEIWLCEPLEDGYVISIIQAEPQRASAASRAPEASRIRIGANLSRKGERRRHERTPISIALVVLWGETPEAENFANAKLVNMSSRGAKLQASVRIPRGAWLIFNNQGLGGRGIVRYCAFAKGNYEIGVEIANGTGWELASKDEDLRRLAAIQPPVEVPEL